MISTHIYKGYQAKFEVEPEDETIFVSVANAPKIHNMTEGETVAEAKAAFDTMIDEYLAACEAEGLPIPQPLVSVYAHTLPSTPAKSSPSTKSCTSHTASEIDSRAL